MEVNRGSVFYGAELSGDVLWCDALSVDDEAGWSFCFDSVGLVSGGGSAGGAPNGDPKNPGHCTFSSYRT